MGQANFVHSKPRFDPAPAFEDFTPAPRSIAKEARRIVALAEKVPGGYRINVFKRLIQRSCPRALSFSQTNR